MSQEGLLPTWMWINMEKPIDYVTENWLDAHGKAGACFLLVLKHTTVVNRAAGKMF